LFPNYPRLAQLLFSMWPVFLLMRDTLSCVQQIGFWKNRLNANGFSLTLSVTEMFKPRFIFVGFQFGILTYPEWFVALPPAPREIFGPYFKRV